MSLQSKASADLHQEEEMLFCQVMEDIPDFRTEISVFCHMLIGPQKINGDIIKKDPMKLKKVYRVIF